jgi:hypothetical protein
MKFSRKEPCPKCPFRRTSIPGWLGGHDATEIVQVILRDGAWPCHQTHTGMSFEEARNHPKVQHCGGAAAFAANMFKTSRDPQVGAHQREVGRRADVFDWPKEFVDYHSPHWRHGMNIGHNQGPSLNRNIEEFQRGMKFRMEVFTGTLSRMEPEFAATKTAASRRRREWIERGYLADIFQITEAGGLIRVR